MNALTSTAQSLLQEFPPPLDVDHSVISIPHILSYIAAFWSSSARVDLEQPLSYLAAVKVALLYYPLLSSSYQSVFAYQRIRFQMLPFIVVSEATWH